MSKIEYRAHGNPPVSPGLFIIHESTRPERIAFVPAWVRPNELEPHIRTICERYAEKGSVLGRHEIAELVGGDQRIAS